MCVLLAQVLPRGVAGALCVAQRLGRAADGHREGAPQLRAPAECVCCLRRCFPGAWQVHFVWPNGWGALLTGIEKERPSYERLLNLYIACAGASQGRGRCTLSGPTAGARC